MNYKLILVFILSSLCVKCQNDIKPKTKADILNDSALAIIESSQSDTSLQQAIVLYKAALKLDSNNHHTYYNLFNLFSRLGECQEALGTINKLISIDSNLPESVVARGFVLEAMNKIEEAESQYLIAKELYDKALELHSDSIELMMNRAFMVTLLYGQPTGMAEFNKIKTPYPQNEHVLYMEEIFKNFDRKQFISEQCRCSN